MARRVVRALAVTTTPLYGAETAAAVGINRLSIRSAVDSLLGSADIITTPNSDRPRITDPMFELWLQSRGLTPDTGEEDES